MDVAVVGETIFRSHTLRLALWRGKAVFLWIAVPVVFGIGVYNGSRQKRWQQNEIHNKVQFN